MIRQQALLQFLQWLDFDIDQKHKTILSLYNNQTVANWLPRAADNGYELTLLYGNGNRKQFLWGNIQPEPVLPGDDDQWLEVKNLTSLQPFFAPQAINSTILSGTNSTQQNFDNGQLLLQWNTY